MWKRSKANAPFLTDLLTHSCTKCDCSFNSLGSLRKKFRMCARSSLLSFSQTVLHDLYQIYRVDSSDHSFPGTLSKIWNPTAREKKREGRKEERREKIMCWIASSGDNRLDEGRVSNPADIKVIPQALPRLLRPHDEGSTVQYCQPSRKVSLKNPQNSREILLD